MRMKINDGHNAIFAQPKTKVKKAKSYVLRLPVPNCLLWAKVTFHGTPTSFFVSVKV